MSRSDSTHEFSIPGLAPRRPDDPWAHRRGEPRTFTLLWTVYLLCATVIAISAVGLHGAVLETGARLAARTILLTAAVGMGLLWPMTRLSQYAPRRRGVGWAVQDTLAIVLPMQAVIWPHIWLAKWSLSTATGASSLLLVWSVLVGGLLAVALHRSRGALVRVMWMVVFVLLLAGAPALDMLMRSVGRPLGEAGLWVRMASPLTGLDHILSRPAWYGMPALTSENWIGIGVTAILAGLVWLVALAMGRGGARSEALR